MARAVGDDDIFARTFTKDGGGYREVQQVECVRPAALRDSRANGQNGRIIGCRPEQTEQRVSLHPLFGEIGDGCRMGVVGRYLPPARSAADRRAGCSAQSTERHGAWSCWHDGWRIMRPGQRDRSRGVRDRRRGRNRGGARYAARICPSSVSAGAIRASGASANRRAAAIHEGTTLRGESAGVLATRAIWRACSGWPDLDGQIHGIQPPFRLFAQRVVRQHVDAPCVHGVRLATDKPALYQPVEVA
ncbi:hypothetical protein QE385_003233 [Sphingomonas sp. SORGH_AS 950]|nr:hypothetical protein [Sphingomonas sp. SORGH_AS_0950]